jgi:hypothetical protein
MGMYELLTQPSPYAGAGVSYGGTYIDAFGQTQRPKPSTCGQFSYSLGCPPTVLDERGKYDLLLSPNRLTGAMRPGGAYGSGQLFAGDRWWDMYVPRTEYAVLEVSGTGEEYDYYYNSDMTSPWYEGWSTSYSLRGFTSLREPTVLGEIGSEAGTRLAASQADVNTFAFGAYGPPAPRAAYQHLTSFGNYAMMTSSADYEPINADDPAQTEYSPLVEITVSEQWTSGGGALAVQVTPGKYENFKVEGSINGPGAMAMAGATNALSLGVDMLGAGDVGDRRYEASFQEDETGNTRAIVTTFHIYQGAAYQIRPAYLSVDDEGNWQETPVVYDYVGPLRQPEPVLSAAPDGQAVDFLDPTNNGATSVNTSSQQGLCWGHSTCHNTAEPQKMPISIEVLNRIHGYEYPWESP